MTVSVYILSNLTLELQQHKTGCINEMWLSVDCVVRCPAI